MIPEIGQVALIIALGIAVIQAFFPLAGAQLGIRPWVNVARSAANLQALFMLVAFGCLVYAFLDFDFSVKYVATNSNSKLPAIYRVSAVWGGHEGSLLLWAMILS
ncbi:MAG: c-type cytochrome biogenesis protein CcmF, partial [Pseudomonadota bacterium]